MRRSKSNPAKYTRNYRKISQRCMTGHDDDDAKAAESVQAELDRIQAQLEGSNSNHQETASNDNNSLSNILSPDLLQDYNDNDNDNIVITSKRKKQKQKDTIAVELSPMEIKQAKHTRKKLQRKLQQLQTRAAQKNNRTVLYQKLQQSAIDNNLLQSSATLGQARTKKAQLQYLLAKERAGVELDQSERDLLYQQRTVVDSDDEGWPAGDANLTSEDDKLEKGVDEKEKSVDTDSKQASSSKTNTNTDDKMPSAEKTLEVEKATKKKKGKKRKLIDNPDNKDDQMSTHEKSEKDDQMDIENKIEDGTVVKDDNDTSNTKEQPKLSFAAQMLASINKLKADTEATKSDNKDKDQSDSLNKLAAEPVVVATTKPYVVTDTIQIKPMAEIVKTAPKINTNKLAVCHVERPEGVQESRYDLPVAAMEYEVMDTIKNHDVTIVCGETGSGKSTQIPQFLYEAGMTGHECVIGITQPRRVAAVSTAKRVCYEMGQGDGQVIRSKESKGNMVAYQTRYESAGLGENTRVKFMTDGILLQEIQSDLLLRKYSVIILDEAHERGLNTDVLIGLLSKAIPLRAQACKDSASSLKPLKLVIMSATLRVSDFTDNKKLFPNIKLGVVNVPGRTYPVTIHHSKITELDNYEDATFKTVCKIHRRLPPGGVLVFLTGKREIEHMVAKLRRVLNKNTASTSEVEAKESKEVKADPITDIRDLDDDEINADYDVDSVADDASLTDEANDVEAEVDLMKDESKLDAYVLPLYSLLSEREQAKVFAAVPEGHRLIVLATNVAETSITIPGITYVVDTGRQKCRNYSAETGVASYNVMWISKAAADQRAGRAGRTGPGHCYRLYSSSLYSRYMDEYALPEVLNRPLEDIVLAMKTMKVSNIIDFPFPTAPNRASIDAAVSLLADLGCLDLSESEVHCTDGRITQLGLAVSRLPLGVRYGKMLLVCTQAGLLDYGITLVAALTENNPISFGKSIETTLIDEELDDEAADKPEENNEKRKWFHKGGDVLARMSAVGAYTYAGQKAGGSCERLAYKRFCDKNNLNESIMGRINKTKNHLHRLINNLLLQSDDVSSSPPILSPPNKLQEQLLLQSIASGLLDNVAMLAPAGLVPRHDSYDSRSVYVSCSTRSKEPMFMDRNSCIYTRDFRQLPVWVCYLSVQRKILKDGTNILVMKDVSIIDPTWLGTLAKGSRLLHFGDPIAVPPPKYDSEMDEIVCGVTTKYGIHGWDLPPARQSMRQILQKYDATTSKSSICFAQDDIYRWFARYLFEGKIIPELDGLAKLCADQPALFTQRNTMKKVVVVVSALSSNGIDSAQALKQHWAEKDDKFLFKYVRLWIKAENSDRAKKLWIDAVNVCTKQWRKSSS